MDVNRNEENKSINEQQLDIRNVEPIINIQVDKDEESIIAEKVMTSGVRKRKSDAIHSKETEKKDLKNKVDLTNTKVAFSNLKIRI